MEQPNRWTGAVVESALTLAAGALRIGARAGSRKCGHLRRLLLMRKVAASSPGPYVFPAAWDAGYATRVGRGLGIVTLAEQERLRTARVCVLGCGGGGGALTLQLVYAGCRELTLVDFDRIELSNLNRQVYTQPDVGRFKAEALAERVLAIDPLVNLRVFTRRAEPGSFAELLEGAAVVVAAMDDPRSVLLCERYCRTHGLPMLYSWMMPCLLAFWFTPESPSYEELIGIARRTSHLSAEELARGEEYRELIRRYEYIRVAEVPAVEDYLLPEEIGTQQMFTGAGGLRTIAPVVWISASFLAFEVIFTGLLRRRPFRNELTGFDYFHLRGF